MTKNKTPRAGLQTSRGAQQKNHYIGYSPDAPYGQDREPSMTLRRQGEKSTCSVQIIPTITSQHIAVSGESSLTTHEGYRDIDRCKFLDSPQLSYWKVLSITLLAEIIRRVIL